MTHRFPIKEIARQAGVGLATVDRVLNNRANVSPQTRLRVSAAVDELSTQEAQMAARGRRLFFDFVVEAPGRFSREVRSAAEAVVPHIGTAVCRPRFVLQDTMEEAEVVAALMRIVKRGSHGVCLKARDTAKIRTAVDALCAANIPVVTLVTDIAGSDRLTYVGLDNAGAGRTAAFLVAKSLGQTSGVVLTTRSHEQFQGEEERETAFAKTLAQHCPNLTIVAAHGGRGVGNETSKVLAGVVDGLMDLRAVYSMGGGNRSILATLADHGLSPDIYVGHDLDRDNRDLLRDRQIDFILHHDLRADIREAFDVFLAYHRLLPVAQRGQRSTVQVVTPENIPVT